MQCKASVFRFYLAHGHDLASDIHTLSKILCDQDAVDQELQACPKLPQAACLPFLSIEVDTRFAQHSLYLQAKKAPLKARCGSAAEGLMDKAKGRRG